MTRTIAPLDALPPPLRDGDRPISAVLDEAIAAAQEAEHDRVALGRRFENALMIIAGAVLWLVWWLGWALS